MQLTTAWTQITTVTGSGAIIQRHSLNKVLVAYAAVTPTTESVFVLRTYEPKTFIDAQAGEFIWAKALNDTAEITVEEIESGSGLLNRVIVSVVDDFPAELDSSVQYFIDGSVDMGTRSLEVPAGGLHLAGYDLELSRLTSTEDNYTLFTSPVGGSGDLVSADLTMTTSGANSQVYNLVDSDGFHAIELTRVNYTDCSSLGTIGSYRQGLESGSGRFGGSPSLTLEGTWSGGFRISTSIARNLGAGMTEPLFKAGTAFIMNSRFLSDINCDLPVSAALLDFSAANFPNPSTLQLKGCEVTRVGAYNTDDSLLTPNVSHTDLCSSWKGNNGLSNTYEGGRLVVTASAVTSIASVSTWYTLNAATWGASRLAHFSNPSAGQLLQLGNSPIEYRAVVNFVVESAQNVVIGVRLRKWDNSASTFIDFPEVRRQVNNLVGERDVAVFNYIFPISLDVGDYCYFQVRNNSGSSDATLELDSDWFIEER